MLQCEVVSRFRSVLRLLPGPRFPLRFAYRVAYPAAWPGPVQVSWGYAQIFRTVPSANTLVRLVNENAFAPIVRARPDPTFGRPVCPWGSPHRLRPGTSPHTLRIPDRSGHPVLRSTSSGGFRSVLAVSGFRLRARLGLSIPSAPFGRRGITPAFGYGAPHPSAGGTSTLPIWALPSAHYEGSDSCLPHSGRQVSPLTSPCLPGIPTPTTRSARRWPLCQSPQRHRVTSRLRHTGGRARHEVTPPVHVLAKGTKPLIKAVEDGKIAVSLAAKRSRPWRGRFDRRSALAPDYLKTLSPELSRLTRVNTAVFS